MPLADIFFIASCIVAPGTLISMLAFARISVRRIERDMKSDGLPRPCPWDGPGLRIAAYMYAIGLPVSRFNSESDPMIDVKLVRSYAKPVDVKLSQMTMLFLFLLLLLIVLDLSFGFMD